MSVTQVPSPPTPIYMWSYLTKKGKRRAVTVKRGKREIRIGLVGKETQFIKMSLDMAHVLQEALKRILN